ncbi:MAG: hypothetical protein Aurels2KO_53630 [Aureliella sp.]
MSTYLFHHSALALLVSCLLSGAAHTSSGQDLSLSETPEASAADRLILVVGAGGTEEYAADHAQWAEAWLKMAENNDWETKHFPASDQPQKPVLLAALAEAASDQDRRLWVVMIGHGTASPAANKFNLVGEDISASELSRVLDKVSARTVVVGSFSASGGFLPKLSRPGRVVVTATRSANELNYSRFGGPFAAALTAPVSDLDHDREVSLLEAYIAASAETARYYSDNNRLASEHAIFDDNGDQVGTPADFFVGVRTVGRAKGKQAPDGNVAGRIIISSLPGAIQLSAEQKKQRAAIEAQVDALRELKDDLPRKDYYEQLEILMLRLAKIYKAAESR